MHSLYCFIMNFSVTDVMEHGARTAMSPYLDPINIQFISLVSFRPVCH